MILMATLGPKASAVVKAGRAGLRGTDADLERVEAALRARLGAHALPPDAAAPASPRGIAWRLMPPAIGVCVIGGALFLALRPEPKRVAEQKPVAVQPATAPMAAIAAAPSAEPAATKGEPTVAAPEPARSAAPSAIPTTAHRARDQLVLEVALLSRATSALNSGRIGEALKALDEHQRQFPDGVLSEERRAAKAQALCSSGRVAEGSAQLAHISPQSPAGKRAQQVCDSAAAARPR